MRNYFISLVVLAGIVTTSACTKTQPEVSQVAVAPAQPVVVQSRRLRSNHPVQSQEGVYVSQGQTVYTPRRLQSVVSAGTNITIVTNELIDAKHVSVGQRFSSTIDSDVVNDQGVVVIPSGSGAVLVVSAAGAGKIHANDLGLELVAVVYRGRSYSIRTDTFFEKGKDGVGMNKRTAKFAGGGAVAGAVLGGIFGGGKGAAIGAAAGAGAGAGTEVLSRGSVKIPAGTVIPFRLESTLSM